MGAESYIKLRNLTVQPGEPVKQILERSLGLLSGLNEKAVFHLRVSGVPAGEPTAYSVVLTPSGCSLQTQRFSKPTLAVILAYDSFARIADGSYSPVQAYLDGKLKLAGDVGLGRRIITHLAGPRTQTADFCQQCPCLYNESWQTIDEWTGQGQITFSGKFFTPNGQVFIVYNQGGAGSYPQIVVADAEGLFTTTQGEIYCGDFEQGVGVIVTAYDLSGAGSVSEGYCTPCL